MTDLHFLSSLSFFYLYQFLFQKNRNTQCKGQKTATQDKKKLTKSHYKMNMLNLLTVYLENAR